MPIEADFSVAANGDIRHVSGTATYTVLELHRYLQDLADNESVTGAADDVLDITSSTPSERSTDNIITLLGTYNIDDLASEFLFAGSIKQGSGATEEIYSGLQILGAVNQTDTQVQIIQDNGLPFTDSPFWGDQVTPFNGDIVAGILLRILVKSREFGADIDGQRIIIIAREYSDSYDFFKVTLGEGEAVGAIGTISDPQNQTAQATVTAYTHVTNIEGFQQIDIGDGNGNQPYYGKWTYGADTSGDQLKGVWEFIKDLVGQATAKTIHGLDGELFFGVTHSIIYDGEAGGPFTEDEVVVWGTDITYDNLLGGTFLPGDYVSIGALGAAGRVMYDNGATNMIVALEDTSITILDDDVITELGAGGTTADVAVTILNNDKEGGSGILLGLEDLGLNGNLYLQVVTGLAPVDELPLRGLTSSATALVNVTVIARTVPKTFLGSFTGSLIGAYGVGIDPGDLLSTDTVEDLGGVTRTPPNNVTFTVSGLVSGQDRLLVGPKAGGNDFNFVQMTLDVALVGGAEVAIDVNVIPDNTPAAGVLRVTLDDGRVRRIAYTSIAGTVFTIGSSSWLTPDDAGIGNGVMVAYIDKLAGATDEDFVTVFSSAQTLWVRARDGGGTPIKTFEAQAALGAAWASTVIRTPDA
jgi:hypothetical protein